MDKTCSSCGCQEFYVRIREFDGHARTSRSTQMRQEVDEIECVQCGATYSY